MSPSSFLRLVDHICWPVVLCRNHFQNSNALSAFYTSLFRACRIRRELTFHASADWHLHDHSMSTEVIFISEAVIFLTRFCLAGPKIVLLLFISSSLWYIGTDAVGQVWSWDARVFHLSFWHLWLYQSTLLLTSMVPSLLVRLCNLWGKIYISYLPSLTSYCQLLSTDYIPHSAPSTLCLNISVTSPALSVMIPLFNVPNVTGTCPRQLPCRTSCLRLWH